MNEPQLKVREFHQVMGMPFADRPTRLEAPRIELRIRLIDEEADELADALHSKDLASTADAIGDLLYVVYGVAVEAGIDIEPIFDEIHRSNMTKKDGTYRADGKLQKPSTFEPPQLAPIIDAQRS